jgi:hypothetical protein
LGGLINILFERKKGGQMRNNYVLTDGREIVVFSDDPKYPECVVVFSQLLTKEIALGDLSHSHKYIIPKSQCDETLFPYKITKSDTKSLEDWLKGIARQVI